MSADLPPNSASPTPEPAPEHAAASEAPVHLRVSQPRHEAVVLTVGGQLDAAGLPHLSEVLWPRLMSASGTLVVDLSAVEFLGVDALELLNQAHLRAAAGGLAVLVVATGHEARHALHMAGLDALCRDSLTEALSDGHHQHTSTDETGQGA